MTEPTDLCFPVLTPFKFRGVVVKPPALVQMDRDEAREYIAAGVIGDEEDAALVPGESERLAAEEAKRQETERLVAEQNDSKNTATGEDGKTGNATEGNATTPAATPAAGGRGGSARKAGK